MFIELVMVCYKSSLFCIHRRSWVKNGGYVFFVLFSLIHQSLLIGDTWKALTANVGWLIPLWFMWCFLFFFCGKEVFIFCVWWFCICLMDWRVCEPELTVQVYSLLCDVFTSCISLSCHLFNGLSAVACFRWFGGMWLNLCDWLCYSAKIEADSAFPPCVVPIVNWDDVQLFQWVWRTIDGTLPRHVFDCAS